jgi:hypothetical protein
MESKTIAEVLQVEYDELYLQLLMLQVLAPTDQ